MFDELQRANPGRIWGFPTESIYKGIEEEVREKLAKEGVKVPTAKEREKAKMNGVNGEKEKGKGRADDAMDIG